MPVLNLADHSLPLLGYLANYGIETRNASFFVNQPIRHYRGRRRGRQFCSSGVAAVVRVLFPIAATIHILVSSISWFQSDIPSLMLLSGLRSLSTMIVFFRLSQKFPELIKLTRKFQQFTIDANQIKATRFQNWPVYAALAYYLTWFFRYYVAIFGGHFLSGPGVVVYFLTWFSSLLYGMACFLPPAACMIIYGVSGYVRIRIQHQFWQLEKKTGIQEKMNQLKTIVDEDYEALRSLATDTDRIIGPIVGSIRFILIIQLFILYKIWCSSNITVLVECFEEAEFILAYWLGYYLYIKSARQTNEMIQKLPKTVCKMLVEMESFEFQEASTPEKLEETPSLATTNDQANPDEHAITVQEPAEQAITVPGTYSVVQPPHSVYGTTIASNVNEDGALKQDEVFDATKMLSLNLRLLTCVTHLRLEKGWFHVNNFPIDGKEILRFWYQWNYMDLMAGRAFNYSHYVKMTMYDFY